MLCDQCKKNEATKVYELVKNGAKKTQNYCLECYIRLYGKEAEGEETLSACPYCGATLDEAREDKLVGCAYCYRVFSEQLQPMISKMQRSTKAHVGKRPTEDMPQMNEGGMRPTKSARYARQRHELTLIIKKLTAERDFDGAKSYADKFSRMSDESKFEEDFVWRANSKRREQL